MPQSASVVVELFPADGKRFYYYPPTISQIIVVPEKGVSDSKLESLLKGSAIQAKKAIDFKNISELSSGTVDVVVCVQALVKLKKEDQLMQLRRVLKPGGRVILVEPLKDFELIGDAFYNVTYDEEVLQMRSHVIINPANYLNESGRLCYRNR